jgi:hypothetical protein
MSLSEIIAALEKADRFSRDVDIAIFKYLHPEYAGYVEGRGGLVHPNDGSDQRVLSGVRWPSYTASVDAALAFCATALPGWRLCFEAVDGIAYDLFILGPLYCDDYPERESSPPIAGKPIAMALVLATLKALQAKEPTA